MKREELRWVDQQVWDDWFTGEMYTKATKYIRKDIKFAADIGAGVGVTTWWMLQNFPNLYHIDCFEPNPENFIRLHDEYLLNDAVNIYPYGVYYGKSWSKVLQVGDNNPLGGITADVNTAEHFSCWNDALRYYPDKIFHYVELESFTVKPDLIKIDIEGSEYNLIENSRYVQTCPYILLETHNHDRAYIENYLSINLPQHRIVLTQGHGIHLGFLLEKI